MNYIKINNAIEETRNDLRADSDGGRFTPAASARDARLGRIQDRVMARLEAQGIDPFESPADGPYASFVHYNDTPAEECEVNAREYEDGRRAAMTDLPFDLEAELIAAAHAAQDHIDTYPRCLGVSKRFCDAAPTLGTPYCVECHGALDALHARAAGCVPPAPATPSPIELITLPNGMIRMTYKRGQIGVCSADALEALRLYLAAPTIEAYDDALDMIEELRAA